MSLGLDRLKSALQALSMKCGGTLEERAKRLFGTKGVSLEDLKSTQGGKKGRGKSKGIDNAKRQRELAALESQVSNVSCFQIPRDSLSSVQYDEFLHRIVVFTLFSSETYLVP